MRLVEILTIFLTSVTFSSATVYFPLYVVATINDPILKIQYDLRITKEPVFEAAWKACPFEDEARDTSLQQFSVGRRATVAELIPQNNLPLGFCKSPVIPVVVQNKFDMNNLEVGYEIEIPNDVKHNTQSNDKFQLKAVTTVESISHHLMGSYTGSLCWFSVLSIQLDDKTHSKQITYDIFSPEIPEHEIKCNMDKTQYHDMINIEKVRRTRIKMVQETGESDHWKDLNLELLVPKKHLSITERQQAACAKINAVHIWSDITSHCWIFANDFILDLAKKLGKLKVIVGTTGILEIKRDLSNMPVPLWQTIDGENVPVPAIIWRLVKYRFRSKIYGTFIDFGIIVVMHNQFSVKAEDKICDDICLKNGWTVTDTNDSVFKNISYCCPVKEEIIQKLGIKMDAIRMNELNYQTIREARKQYQTFHKQFFKT